MTRLPEAITVRPASVEDTAGLLRLAALDSAALPAAPVIVAEVDGELRAALSLVDGRSVADPFHPSLDLVDLLRLHASTIAATPVTRPRRSARRRPALRFA